MLAHDLAMALDPVAFARHAIGFDPDPWQAGVLARSSPRLLLLCCRQAGKSTVSALLALHAALFERALVLVLSPTERQSAELLRKVRGFLVALGPGAPAVTAASTAALEFATGGRLVALPGH